MLCYASIVASLYFPSFLVSFNLIQIYDGQMINTLFPTSYTSNRYFHFIYSIQLEKTKGLCEKVISGDKDRASRDVCFLSFLIHFYLLYAMKLSLSKFQRINVLIIR